MADLQEGVDNPTLPESWFQEPDDAEVAAAPSSEAAEGTGLSVRLGGQQCL